MFTRFLSKLRVRISGMATEQTSVVVSNVAQIYWIILERIIVIYIFEIVYRFSLEKTFSLIYTIMAMNYAKQTHILWHWNIETRAGTAREREPYTQLP